MRINRRRRLVKYPYIGVFIKRPRKAYALTLPAQKIDAGFFEGFSADRFILFRKCLDEPVTLESAPRRGYALRRFRQKAMFSSTESANRR